MVHTVIVMGIHVMPVAEAVGAARAQHPRSQLFPGYGDLRHMVVRHG